MDIQPTLPATNLQNTSQVEQAPKDSVNRLMNSSNQFIAKMTTPSNKFIAKLKMTNPVIAGKIPSANPIIAGGAQNTKPITTKESGTSSFVDKRRNLSLTQDDINEARAIMYGEVGTRPYDKKVLEANVVLNSALNRLKMIKDAGGTATLKDVLVEPRQFQAFGGENYKLAKSGKIPEFGKERMKAIDEVINKMLSGELEDITEGGIAYHHYDDPKTKERKIKLTKYNKAWASGNKIYFK